jgi:SAM-dependent methyltransferase
MTGDYIIKGGLEGRARLAVLAAAMGPSTRALLDAVGIPEDAHVLDAGCGGGDVSRDLKQRVGPRGHVTGIDFDATKVAIAAQESAGQEGLQFRAGDVLKDDLGGPHDVVYARFLLSHLHEPVAALKRFISVLKPGGLLIAEDVDFSGHFCDPPRQSFDNYVRWYEESARRHGADAGLGRRLPSLFDAAGLPPVETRAANPAARTGPLKQMAALTLHAIAGSLVELGIASENEITRDHADLVAAAEDPAVFMSVPRIVQCWARKA